jgi:IS5 family transposase
VSDQRTFAGLAWSEKGKVTRRERFLAEMDAVIPWDRLLKLIEPHYPKKGRGRQPLGLEKMLRIYFLQQWFDRSDPEMKQTKKGNNWYFGMKLHIGKDIQGLVHSVTGTNAGTNDITQMPALLHGEEKAVLGDRAYWSEKDRQRFREEGVACRVNRQAAPGKTLGEGWRKINRIRSKTRCMVEHPILVVKGIWGFRKTRYRGLRKNLARGYTMFALANLYRARSTLMPPGVECAL